MYERSVSECAVSCTDIFIDFFVVVVVVVAVVVIIVIIVIDTVAG
jgi:hypothetical protein